MMLWRLGGVMALWSRVVLVLGDGIRPGFRRGLNAARTGGFYV